MSNPQRRLAATEERLLQILVRLNWLLLFLLAGWEGWLAYRSSWETSLIPLDHLLIHFALPCGILLGSFLLLQFIARMLAKFLSLPARARMQVITSFALIASFCFFYPHQEALLLFLIPVGAGALSTNLPTLLTAALLSLGWEAVLLLIGRLVWHPALLFYGGAVVVVFLLCLPLPGRVRRLVDGAVDKAVEEERRLRETLTDRVSGLSNREAFWEDLEQLLSEFQEGGAPFSMVLLDVDDTEALSPLEEETLFASVGRMIQLHMEEGDHAFRWGDHLFAILTTRTEQAIQMAQSIRLEFSRQEELPQPLTLSCGICVIPQQPASSHQLFFSALSSLYRAKQSGKNCVRLAL